MFKQLLTPVGGSLGLSFLVAILPIVAVLVLLGLLRRPAWQAALAGLSSAWSSPSQSGRCRSVSRSTRLRPARVRALAGDVDRRQCAPALQHRRAGPAGSTPSAHWVINHLPNDRRVVLVVIGFCFGALLEGVAGFGTPVAITSSLLILVGFPPLEALVFVLIFNTAPVAFGALGVPVTVLGAVTGLPATALGGDDRPAVAGHGADPAVLCDGDLRRHALGPRAVAGPARRRRQFRGCRSSSRPTFSTTR